MDANTNWLLYLIPAIPGIIGSVLAWIALRQARGRAVVRQVETNTARDQVEVSQQVLVTQMAANTNKATSDASEARIEAITAKSDLAVLTVRFDNLEKTSSENAEKSSRRIDELQAEVRELKAQIVLLTTELTAERAKTAALEAEKK